MNIITHTYSIQHNNTIIYEKDYNRIRFKVKYNMKTYTPDRIYDQTYTTTKLNNYYILPSAKSAFISYRGLLYMLKKLKINRFLVDIKEYNQNIFENQLVDKNSYKDMMVFKNPYKSTNGSAMTLVMIDLSKIKLNQIKK